MSGSSLFAPGNFRFVPGVFQYSGGVAAEPGYRIERVRFATPLPLDEGFRRAGEIIRAAGRPLTAFCACELRSPAPFDEAGFEAFNRIYTGTLTRWGLFDGQINPVARSNVCPELAPPLEPSFHAFSYTVPAADARSSFVVSGSAEAPEGRGNYKDHIVRRGDLSEEGLRLKVRWVLEEMERRMAALGFGWGDSTGSQVYTVHNIHPYIAQELAQRGAIAHGLTWHFVRPPVVDFEYEMDCRGVHVEYVA